MQIIKEYSGIKVTINEEDLNKKGVIYLMEFPNGKVYIGQSQRTVSARIPEHCKEARRTTIVKKALDKFHEVSVTVLCSGLDIDQLNVFEIFFIKAFSSNNRNFGYNQEAGGNGGIVSDERKKNISLGKKGKHWSDAAKESCKIKKTGVKTTNKKVVSSPDNIVFKSAKEAAIHYGISPNKLSRYYNGKRHTASGQTFILLNNSK